MKKREKKKKKLKWSMVVLVVCGWLLPVAILTLGMLYFVTSIISRQIERTIVISTDKAVEICEMQLNDAVVASKNASYMPTIRESYRDYLRDNKYNKLATRTTYFLSEQYKYNANFLCSMLFYMDNPEEIYIAFNTYMENNNTSQGYKQKMYFKENVLEQVLEEGERLDTGMKLMIYEEHVYLVRNIMDTTFTPYAMIVIELDTDKIMGGLESVWGAQDYQIYVDGEAVYADDSGKDFDREKRHKITEKSIYERGKDIVYKTVKWENQKLTYLVELDADSIIEQMFFTKYVGFIVILFMIPLVAMISRFFAAKITKPMTRLVEGAKEISLGNYGHQIEAGGGSEEVDYLNNAFNTMSAELKYQFETIYKEELALKDANIKALQSQINPHFLNNTLEIINWEARMNGNETVSGMIEALATMLNATMNRRQRRFVQLSEELSYVDAYLYIIGKRFGERFQVKREIDESLLEMQVPMLIIQPIVENAVAHGIEENKHGKVEIKIYKEEDKLCIEVINDGALSPRDKERIERLLYSEETEGEEQHISLGIRNVNRRLKIIYGEECGLTIKSDRENRTVSRIVVKMWHESNNSQ